VKEHTLSLSPRPPPLVSISSTAACSSRSGSFLLPVVVVILQERRERSKQEKKNDGAEEEGNVAVPQGGRLQPAGEVGPLRRLLRRRRLRLRGMHPTLSYP
jgi:hypothetical protein